MILTSQMPGAAAQSISALSTVSQAAIQLSDKDNSGDIRSLTRSVQRGDSKAYSRFYDLYSLRIFKYALVLGRGDEHLAMEVSQLVFIKVANGMKRFECETKLWAWLSTLARNAFIDLWRLRQREQRILQALPSDYAVQVNADRRLVELLREILSEFSPIDQELMESAYIDKRSLKELADQAGDSYKAIESRLGRLRKAFRERLLKRLQESLKQRI